MEPTEQGAVAATEATFDALIARPGLTLVDFWAGWCGPCVRFAPVFAAAAAAHPETQFVKVDTEAEEALSLRFEIRSIPTLIAFRNSRVVHRASGALSRAALEALVTGLAVLEDATIDERQANIARTARGERPDGVPADAQWDEDDEEWHAGATTDAGKQGVWKAWRADGTFASERRYVDDCLDGEAREFHEDGSVASVRTFAADARTGIHVFHAPRGFSTVSMPFREVAPQVTRVEIEHDEQGRGTICRAFDRDGNRVLLATGEPYPTRPASLPETATFEESENCFVDATVKDGNYVGLVRKWDRDGRVLREMMFDDNGMNGRYLAREGAFVDPRAVFERGTMRDNYAAGVWELLDENQQVLRRVDVGEPLDTDALWASPVAENRARTAEEWETLSRQLVSEGRQTEALLAAARAAGVQKRPDVLNAFADTFTLVRTEEGGFELANRAAQSEDFSYMANALLRGARLSSVLQLLCVMADRAGRPRFALDLVDAALALVPDKHPYLRSRALLLLELGQVEDMDDIVRRLEPVEADDATLFREYAKLLFPRFGMWQPQLAKEGTDRTVRQSLDAVRRVAAVYATRLAILRDRIVQRVESRGDPTPAWLPPNIAEVLSDGRVELAERTIDVDGETVTVDETVGSSETVRRLMAEWRDEWAALCLLLWAVGEDAVRIPTALAPRAELGRADAAVAGFLARLQGDEEVAPDDAHQIDGISYDELNGQGANMARSQLFEMKVLLDWLTDARYVSPWQSDLRGGNDDDDD